MTSLTTLTWLPSLLAFMTPASLPDEQESPPVSTGFNEATRTLALTSEKMISPEEAMMLNSHDPIVQPQILVTDPKSTLHLLSLEGVCGLSFTYFLHERPAPVTVELEKAPDADLNSDLKPITRGCRLLLQIEDHVQVNQEDFHKVVELETARLSEKINQAPTHQPLVPPLASQEQPMRQAQPDEPSSHHGLSKAHPDIQNEDVIEKDKMAAIGRISSRETMPSISALRTQVSTRNEEESKLAGRSEPMTPSATNFDQAKAQVDGVEKSWIGPLEIQAPFQERLNTDRPQQLDLLEGEHSKQQEGGPEEPDLAFCFSYLSDLQDISTMDSLRVIENNTVRYDRAIVDYLYDRTSYFSSGDPDFRQQLAGLLIKAQKNASAHIIKRIKRDYPEKLGLNYALFREAMSKMTDQNSSEQVRTSIEPLFAPNPEKGSPEEAYQVLLNLRASGQDTEADQFENDLTGQFPECIEFLQTKTLYFVKQGLFKATMDAIKKDSKSDCYQNIKTCLKPLLPARVGLAWALHIATVRCNHLECSIRQAFTDGEKQTQKENKDFIADLKEIDANFEDADLDTVISMIETNGDQPIQVESLLFEIDEIENEEAKEATRQVVLQFAHALTITDLEQSLIASSQFSQDESMAQDELVQKEPKSFLEPFQVQDSLIETSESQSQMTPGQPAATEVQASTPQPPAQTEAILDDKSIPQPDNVEESYTDYFELLTQFRKEGEHQQAITFENDLTMGDLQAMKNIVLQTPYFQQMQFFRYQMAQLRTKLKQGRKTEEFKEALRLMIPDRVGLAYALYLKISQEIQSPEVLKELEANVEPLFVTQPKTILDPTPEKPPCQTPFEALQALAKEHPEEKNLSFLVSLLEGDQEVEQSFGSSILSRIQNEDLKEEATKLFDSLYEKKDPRLLGLLKELESPSNEILTEWVDSRFKSVPSQTLTLGEESMAKLYDDFFKVEDQLESSDFSSQAWIQTLSKCQSELQDGLAELEVKLNSTLDLSKKKQKIQQCLKELEEEHPSHPLPAHLYTLCNSALPGLDLEVPLKLEELQERDLEAVKKVLPLLEGKMFTITDFITVREEFNEENVMASLWSQSEGKKFLDGENLIMLMFDFVKRRLPFTDILLKLQEDFSELKLTTRSMFDYLMRHSDPDLRALLVISCSQFMAIPFLFKSPWSSGYVIIEEHFYVFERSKSILQIKLSKTGKNLPKGSSEFLNKLLGKSFEEPSASYANNGSIEIQYDFNCSSTEYIVAADYHGKAELEVVKKLLPLFSTVLIHSTVGQEQFINEFVSLQDQETKFIVYYHDPSRREAFAQQGHVVIGYHHPFTKCQSQEKELILRQCQQVIIDFFEIPLQIYVKDLQQRVEQKKQFIEVLKTLNCQQIVDYEGFYHQVKKIVELILKTKDFQSTSFLPVLHYITLRTEIQDKLAKSGLGEGEVRQLNRLKKENDENIQKCEPTEVVNCFKDVLVASNVMKMSFFLLNLIKGHIEQKTLSLESQKDLILEKVKELKGEQNEPERLAFLAEIARLEKEIRKLQFSPEHAFRELYHLSETDRNRHLLRYSQNYQLKQIQHGQPWELIDGDNLLFLSEQRKVLSQIQNSSEDILVVSVIGPQSAGKSLLMNLIFGTQFLSSAGRCTKGIYASILPYKCKNGKTKNILILDTEGIQSAEDREKDTMFDKRIVYFIMCVSHVVLVVNKQEMNQDMTEVMKLVGNAILETKQDLIENPSILIIMNLLAQIKQSTARDCFRTLKNALEEDPDPNMKNALALSLNQIFPLEFAFNRVSFGPKGNEKTVNGPFPAISKKIFNLRRIILEKFTEVSTKATSQFTLEKWFKFAEEFWFFTEDFKGLIEYNSLSQKRKDLSLAEQMDQLLKKYYESEMFEETKKKHDRNLEEIFENSIVQKFEDLSREIKPVVNESFTSINSRIVEEFDRFCLEKEIPQDLIKKRSIDLSRSDETNRQRELTRLNLRISELVKNLSKKAGDNNLRDLSTSLLKKKDSYTIEESEKEFDQGWTASIKKMRTVLNQESKVREQVFDTTIQEFDLRAKTGSKSTKQYFIIGQRLELYNSMLPIREFAETKDRERKLFIAKLTCNNKAADTALGESIGGVLLNYLKDKFLKKSATKFKKDLEDNKADFEKADTIFKMEKELVELFEKTQKGYFKKYFLSSKDKELKEQALKFYPNPTQFLESMFESKFDYLQTTLIAKMMQQYEFDLKSHLRHIESYFRAFDKELRVMESDKNARCLFVLEEAPEGQDMNQDNKVFSEAFSKYFQRFIQQVWKDEDIIFVDGASLKKHPKYKLPQPAGFKMTLDSDVVLQILGQVDGNPIYRLDQMLLSAAKFLEEAIIELESQDPQNEDDILLQDKITGECMKDFKRFYTGCPSFCPMCRRQCDVDHGSTNLNDQIHRCMTGHQLQCFGGNRNFTDHKAITRSCSEIKEHHIVEYKNREYKWAVLKQQEELRKWNYEEADCVRAEKVREKSRKIWNLIGEDLCHKYRQTGVPIDFIEAREDQELPGGDRIHYIMALDESGSMCGEPWQQLMGALKTFLSELEILKAPGTKVSIIKYSSSSTIAFENIDPEARIAGELSYRGGRTNFDPPLKDAFTLATRYKGEFDKIIIYFMTDGWANYTKETANQFHDPTISHMIQFHAVSFGDAHSEQMQNLAQDMPNGQQTAAPTAEDLKKSMLKIISNVFRS